MFKLDARTRTRPVRVQRRATMIIKRRKKKKRKKKCGDPSLRCGHAVTRALALSLYFTHTHTHTHGAACASTRAHTRLRWSITAVHVGMLWNHVICLSLFSLSPRHTHTHTHSHRRLWRNRQRTVSVLKPLYFHTISHFERSSQCIER